MSKSPSFISKAVLGGAVVGVALLLLAWGGNTSPEERLADAQVLIVPPMDRPDYRQSVTDPKLGTRFARVTDPGQHMKAGIICRPGFCRHRYSSTQAWNADQTLFAIFKGCNGICFLDGQTYEPLFFRLTDDDCKWHPTNPALMICVRASQVYAWAPRTNAKTAVYVARGYSNVQFGPYKGNLSQDGNRLVLRAINKAGALVAFAYDMAEKRKYPDIDLAALPGVNDYCGISASGRYILCSSTKDERIDVAYVLTVDGKLVQSWTEHHRPGHGDMTIDADGSDVYVGISKSDPDKWHVIKRRLSDGAITDLVPSGYGAHVSARNINRPGWVFVSYEGTYEKIAGSVGRAPFYQEVVALRIDGSGEIRRIGQTRNLVADYISETHASPSPDGSQVVWSSNWGTVGGPVADYVSRVSWPDEAAGH